MSNLHQLQMLSLKSPVHRGYNPEPICPTFYDNLFYSSGYCTQYRHTHQHILYKTTKIIVTSACYMPKRHPIPSEGFVKTNVVRRSYTGINLLWWTDVQKLLVSKTNYSSHQMFDCRVCGIQILNIS